MNVYIGGPVEYSDMQGPCPDGFHVPLSSERIAIKNAGVNLGAWGSNDGNNFSTYLKIPMAGMRDYYTNTDSVGSYGHYWASDYYSSDSALKLTFLSYKITSNDTGYYSYGLPIRGIKNSPVTPTSSWTVLYQGSGSAGIYHNPDLGLISISSDGSTWYTLMDKNLGATTLYNYGDTLTDANCGNVFQRGNNHAFPGTLSSDSITTSGSQVDASDYGPGNYYESSTWFQNRGAWFYPSNYNLRGGTSQGTSTKSAEVKNIYIGEYVKPDYLCFTANTAGSTIKLQKNGSPTSVTLETSTDGEIWNTYTIGSTITLTNIGDKVYWRNTSTSTTGFSGPAYNSYYKFVMTGSIAASGDINYLLNKNSTTTLSGDYIYARLFFQCASLTSTPRLPATTLSYGCYQNMFMRCSNLETLPSLPAITLTGTCYSQMFSNCSKIKLSTSKTGDYQTAYRIPTTGTGTDASSTMMNMFYNTGGTFTGTPSINTTYYTSNTVV